MYTSLVKIFRVMVLILVTMLVSCSGGLPGPQQVCDSGQYMVDGGCYRQ